MSGFLHRNAIKQTGEKADVAGLQAWIKNKIFLDHIKISCYAADRKDVPFRLRAQIKNEFKRRLRKKYRN